MKYLIFAALFIFFSCENKEIEVCQGINCDLIGEWSWTKTYGTIAGQTWTPESTGEEKELIIDDLNISFYTDGTLVDEFEYEVFETDTFFRDSIMRTFIKYNKNTRWMTLEGDDLEFIDLCFDCLDDTYVRK